jgi:alpha-ketoglutarate-dependent 2,4-dichlorophenoxyacetate dioxygenase
MTMTDALASTELPTGLPFDIRPLSPLMGAEIFGLDLSRAIDDAMRDAILDALNRYHVLVFRKQDLPKEAQLAFTRRFGELEPHVNRDFRSAGAPEVHPVNNLDENQRPSREIKNIGNYSWHTDKSYMARPSLATLLYAVQLPPQGGDTEFADMQAAYDALPEERKHSLAPLRVVHSWERSRQKSGSKPATEEEKQDAPPVVHPLVRTHPATGRKGLYIGNHTSHIDGWSIADGEALLSELQAFATQERFVYRHRWQPGDMVMWDNRCLLHRALPNFEMDRYARVLNRTVVRGPVPA